MIGGFCCGLAAVRALRCGRMWSTTLGMLFGGIEMWLASYKVNLPWTLHHKEADHETLIDINKSKPINYLKPDGIFTFDNLISSCLLSCLKYPLKFSENLFNTSEMNRPIKNTTKIES